MGCANNWMIPPAILYNNPGITKGEFAEILNKTRTGDGTLAFYSFVNWKEAPWGFTGIEDWDYHKGLHGLAEILGLHYSNEFKKIDWKDKDWQGTPLSAPYLEVTPQLSNGKWFVEYQVTVHAGNTLLEEEIAEGWEREKKRKGDIFFGDHSCKYLIQEILEQTPLTEKEKKDLWGGQRMDVPNFFTRIKGNLIMEKIEYYKFCSISSLLRKFPYFDPDFMYDWSMEEGVFSAPMMLRNHNQMKKLIWRQDNGRYHLDIEPIPPITKFGNKIPNLETQSGYTDLIVSSEALKLKAWKMFVFHAYERERTELFLKTFPQAAEAHAKAVWDGYTSEYAKMNEMTINEFLRFRLLLSRKR